MRAQNAQEEMTSLEQDVQDMEDMQRRLAAYFCEDERTFRLDECAKVFDDFLSKLQKAEADNRVWQLQESKAEQRRKNRESRDLQNNNDG